MLYRNRKLYPPYPVISLTTADKKFIIFLSRFLENQGFNVDLILEDNSFDERVKKTWYRSRLRLSGRQNLDLWMQLIGFRNRRHLNKYEEYLRSGAILRKIGRPKLKIKGKISGDGEI